MDNQIIGSLNSLADYGLGESDIEDSDEDVEPKHKPIVVVRPSVAQPRVKTSLVPKFVFNWKVWPKKWNVPLIFQPILTTPELPMHECTSDVAHTRTVLYRVTE